MGLPLFIAPAEPQVASRSAEKIAAIPRSAIRRSAVRSGRNNGESRRHRVISMVERTSPEEYQIWENQRPLISADRSFASLQMRTQRMFEEEERSRAREPFSFERQQPSNNDPDGPIMPPVPESRDYSSIEDRRENLRRQARLELRRIARGRPPTISPFAEGDPASTSRWGPSSPHPSSLAPALNSLHPSPGSTSPPPIEDYGTIYNQDLTSSSRATSRALPRSPLSSLSERVQAINRASSEMVQSQRLRRQARLDGLGDRDRSLSPEGGAVWDTLLTSITPDPQPPSAGSSFTSTSAAAAAASSSSGGQHSTNSSMTSSATSQDAVAPCDLSDSSSDSDEDDDLYELRDYNNNRVRADRFWRTYANVATTGSNRASRQDVSDPEHLVGMHRIISSLAERNEIPDSWWASAGLSRNIPRESST